MAWFGKKNSLLKLIVSYIFPINCFACGEELDGEDYLCSSCFDKIKFFKELPCFICNSGAYVSGICEKCRGETALDRIFVATTYTDNVVGKMVEQAKYNFVETALPTLGKIIIEAIERQHQTQYFENSVFIPISLHRKRFAERGFNQAEALARTVAMKYNGEVRLDILNRMKNTRQQAKLARQQRIENVKDAFGVNLVDNIPQKVILVDDVLTTGITFQEAAKALKTSGVKEVTCLAVCHG